MQCLEKVDYLFSSPKIAWHILKALNQCHLCVGNWPLLQYNCAVCWWTLFQWKSQSTATAAFCKTAQSRTIELDAFNISDFTRFWTSQINNVNVLFFIFSTDKTSQAIIPFNFFEYSNFYHKFFTKLHFLHYWFTGSYWIESMETKIIHFLVLS